MRRQVFVSPGFFFYSSSSFHFFLRARFCKAVRHPPLVAELLGRFLPRFLQTPTSVREYLRDSLLEFPLAFPSIFLFVFFCFKPRRRLPFVFRSLKADSFLFCFVSPLCVPRCGCCLPGTPASFVTENEWQNNTHTHTHTRTHTQQKECGWIFLGPVSGRMRPPLSTKKNIQTTNHVESKFIIRLQIIHLYISNYH